MSIKSSGISDGSTLKLSLLPPSQVRVSPPKMQSASSIAINKMRRLTKLRCSGEPAAINPLKVDRKMVPEVGLSTVQEAPSQSEDQAGWAGCRKGKREGCKDKQKQSTFGKPEEAPIQPEDQAGWAGCRKGKREGCKDKQKQSTFGKPEAFETVNVVRPTRFGIDMVPRCGPNLKKHKTTWSRWAKMTKDFRKAPMQIQPEPEPLFTSLIFYISSPEDAICFVDKHDTYLAVCSPMRPSFRVQQILAKAGLHVAVTNCADVAAILLRNHNCILQCAIVNPEEVVPIDESTLDPEALQFMSKKKK